MHCCYRQHWRLMVKTVSNDSKNRKRECDREEEINSIFLNFSWLFRQEKIHECLMRHTDLRSLDRFELHQLWRNAEHLLQHKCSLPWTWDTFRYICGVEKGVSVVEHTSRMSTDIYLGDSWNICKEDSIVSIPPAFPISISSSSSCAIRPSVFTQRENNVPCPLQDLSAFRVRAIPVVRPTSKQSASM